MVVVQLPAPTALPRVRTKLIPTSEPSPRQNQTCLQTATGSGGRRCPPVEGDFQVQINPHGSIFPRAWAAKLALSVSARYYTGKHDTLLKDNFITIKMICSNASNFLEVNQKITRSYKWGADTVPIELPLKMIFIGTAHPLSHP